MVTTPDIVSTIKIRNFNGNFKTPSEERLFGRDFCSGSTSLLRTIRGKTRSLNP
jgi:hypothetical protein